MLGDGQVGWVGRLDLEYWGALVLHSYPGSVVSLPLDLVKLPSRKRKSALATRSSSSPEPPGTCERRQLQWGLSWLWGGRHPSSSSY